MDVSIIIVSYNTKDLTLQCIESVIRNTHNLQYEIIVVDNASSDCSCEAINQKFNNVNLVRSENNLGFGKANNLGVKHSKGKYVFFLNSDTILIKNSIRELFVFNQVNLERIKIGVSGGLLLNELNEFTGSFGPLPSILGVIKSTVGLAQRFSKLTEEYNDNLKNNGFFEVGYVMGADMFIEKESFLEAGGFDDGFFMYYEETDLQANLKRNGYKNIIINNSELVHLEGMSTNSTNTSNSKRIMFTTSMMRYFKKHNNYLIFSFFKTIYFLLRLGTLFLPNYSWLEKKRYMLAILKS